MLGLTSKRIQSRQTIFGWYFSYSQVRYYDVAAVQKDQVFFTLNQQIWRLNRLKGYYHLT